ncbi:Na+/H+ antiporter NhaC [Companilactobacillus sp. RD055328]|uniref:Na+/H+ antiporter NhaC n=1 Tax=Companilactobacillus sp. RD055328 TaxID=2916634 RepID=UPI001FC8187A|nr:Na+/H+ antiporter NhaC [Companilactobacillus sp. RD055328]GKQ42980.1 Na+/H+ antiporter NhaC [Companilactobacillus sp. RD055328]
MKKNITISESIIVLLTMIVLLGFSVIKLGLAPQIPILFIIALLILWAQIRGFSWDDIIDGIEQGVTGGIIPIVIFILIGALIGSWIAAGVIPALMVVGFKIISVQFFVPSVFLVCAVIGTSIGSAFTIISTIGIALLGMGNALGIDPVITSGAVISGAIFGDKTSPLSDSTNLAAAISGADLFDHIKHLMWTTVPALIISLVFFAIINPEATGAHTIAINQLQSEISNHFVIGWWQSIPIILMFVCAIIKMPAIGTLLLNISVSVGLIYIQDSHISIQKITNILNNGYILDSADKNLSSLLSRGGIISMMPTVALIIITLSLGGLLMKFGIIQNVIDLATKNINKTGNLVLMTILSGLGVNIFVGEQYLSAILPGNAFRKVYDKKGFKPVVLSRILEDGGTVINYLIPWGVAGSFAAATLGVPTQAYLPFVIFAWISPILSVISGYTGIGIDKKEN